MSLNPTLLLIILLALSQISTLSCTESTAPQKFILTSDSSILSENKTFKLGFLSTNGDDYLGIWYASIPTPTYVWIANRETPLKKNQNFSSYVSILQNGYLSIVDNDSNFTVWQTRNQEKACEVRFLDSGNLVLLSCNDADKKIVWQSFDFPTDTWLPGMNLTVGKPLISWKSFLDPSIGLFSLGFKPPQFGEIVLVYNETMTYWTTGNWTGNAFLNVPEMTVPYIYKFQFFNPFTPMATFGYTETSSETEFHPPLSRFQLDYTGQLWQFTWNSQTESWSKFWSRPDNRCKVYNLCGNFGFCNDVKLKPCDCLVGFSPVDEISWGSGDFSGGCYRKSERVCSKDNRFEEVGVVSFNGATSVLSTSNQKDCEESCLSNCSCIGLYHNGNANICKNLYGSMLNLRNLTSDSTNEDILYVRVDRRSDVTNKKNVKIVVLIGCITGFSLVLLLFSFAVLLILLRRRRKRGRKEKKQDDVFPYTNLKVFSYRELHATTQGFSEKLGHGGFGAVFKGELSDSSLVAVKRLERPNGSVGAGGGEKEFRAEVCTIGNIQHVNLVRLRGFCSENLHRLLVYDYMQNGPLSMYLKKNGPNLSWEIRFRIAIGTAKGVAYLHEECRDCIIHCDIKPENILLDSDFTAKVSDFGLAKLIGRDFSRVLATTRGTWGYVAPEWISGVAITAKADVYSYGMTLLELISGRRNVEPPLSNKFGDDEFNDDGDKWFFPPWAARQIIDGNVSAVVDERLSCDGGGGYDKVEAERLGLVAIWCIQDDEATRPTMGMVVKMLEGVVEVTIPPSPKLIQALVSGESFRGVESGLTYRTSAGGGDELGVSQSSIDCEKNSLGS